MSDGGRTGVCHDVPPTGNKNNSWYSLHVNAPCRSVEPLFVHAKVKSFWSFCVIGPTRPSSSSNSRTAVGKSSSLWLFSGNGWMDRWKETKYKWCSTFMYANQWASAKVPISSSSASYESTMPCLIITYPASICPAQETSHRPGKVSLNLDLFCINKPPWSSTNQICAALSKTNQWTRTAI